MFNSNRDQKLSWKKKKHALFCLTIQGVLMNTLESGLE